VKLCKDILKVLNIEEDKCKLILNRAYQEMGIHHEDVENQLGPIDCFIPSDGQLVIPSLNMGKPFVLDHPASVPIVKSMYELCMLSVDDVDRDLAEPPKQQITEQDKSFGRFFKKILNK
jgi:hypothetical protein